MDGYTWCLDQTHDTRQSTVFSTNKKSHLHLNINSFLYISKMMRFFFGQHERVFSLTGYTTLWKSILRIIIKKTKMKIRVFFLIRRSDKEQNLWYDNWINFDASLNCMGLTAMQRKAFGIWLVFFRSLQFKIMASVHTVAQMIWFI